MPAKTYMKIVFVARSLDRGGSERQLVNLARQLALRGHTVSVALFYGGELAAELANAGIPVHHLEKRSRWDLIGPLRRLVTLLRRDRPDIIHGYLPAANIMAVLAGRIAGGVKTVIGVRASDMDLSRYDDASLWTYRVEAWFARLADLVIANSAAGLESAWRRRFPGRRGIIVRNGTDTERFRPDGIGRQRWRRQLGLSDETIVVGMVARRDPMKDHEGFLEAAAVVAHDRPGTAFLLAGNGVDGGDPALARLASKVEAPVHLLGKIADIEGIMATLDLAVLTSRFGEGFPNVVAEAMACGVPAVVTAVGDSPLIVGEPSRVVPPGNPGRLAEACLALLTRVRDPVVSEQCRSRVIRLYSLPILTERTEFALAALTRPLLVHVITDLDVGGAETVLYRLAQESRSFRHVVISLTDDGTYGPRLREVGVEVVALGMERGRPAAIAFLRLVRLLHQLKPSVVQTWLYHADLVGLLAARLVGIRSVAWNLRCSDMDLSRYSRMTRGVVAAARTLSSLPRVVIANSQMGLSCHQALGYRAASWKVIRNGVDAARFRPDADSRRRWRDFLGVGDQVVLIGMVARRDPMKDHEGLLVAATDLARSAKVEIVFAGRGVGLEDHRLAKIAARVPTPVHWVGSCNDVAGLMAALDIFVLSSRFGEGTPNVVLEAMAVGLPCIVSDVGDAAAVVGDAGLVVAPGDIAGLGSAIRRLVDDPVLRRALGVIARERVETEFALQDMVKNYESTWMDIARTGTVFNV